MFLMFSDWHLHLFHNMKIASSFLFKYAITSYVECSGLPNNIFSFLPCTKHTEISNFYIKQSNFYLISLPLLDLIIMDSNGSHLLSKYYTQTNKIYAF